jgi:hypothetical protein
MGEYIPGAPVNEEARKRNGNLPGMGGIFNTVNLHVYHYAGNNPLKYTDPDGKKIFDSRWWARNWDNLASAGLGVAEAVAGAGIAGATGITGAGAFAGGLMVIHGGANAFVQASKITITTIAADLHGDNYADVMDLSMPDTAIGVVTWALGLAAEAITGFTADNTAEKAGAVGDLLDIAVGLGISGAVSRNLTRAIQSFKTSSGSTISKADLMKLNTYLEKAGRNTVAKVVQGMIDNFDRVKSFGENTGQLE